MKAIDRLLMKAKKRINRVVAFLSFIVPDEETAGRVSEELDEFCGDRPYHAVIIYGENDLDDDAEGVTIHHMGGVT